MWNGYVETPGDVTVPIRLGCAGFLILSGGGKVVCPRTLPWRQHGRDAFLDVERVLREIGAGDPNAK